MQYEEDTIAALISAPGQAAIACIRVSGPEVCSALATLVERSGQVQQTPRMLVYSAVFDLLSAAGSSFADSTVSDHPPHQVLDYALVSFFKGPKSFTGEDSAEFQLHGSTYVVQRLLENLYALGIRQAEPGEFSKRAYLNGRMDLSQAEGVADLIAAETEAQARVAEQQLSGRLSKTILDLGEPLRDLVAEIEAYIDFPDEDIEPLEQKKWLGVVERITEDCDRYVRSYRTGKVFRDGAKVVLAGLPNAGKSSLLNALSGENRAIVTPIAGTTRDSIEQRLSLGGLAVNLWDTAGLVDVGGERDEVEKLGIERSWQLLEAADVVVFVFSPELSQAAQSSFYARVARRSQSILSLINKKDTLDLTRQRSLQREFSELIGEPPLLVSAQTGAELERFLELLRERLVGRSTPQDALLICNRRHFEALLSASEALERTAMLLRSADGHAEFVSLELRAALGALQEIVGSTHTEDILGRIFSKFCIGK